MFDNINYVTDHKVCILRHTKHKTTVYRKRQSQNYPGMTVSYLSLGDVQERHEISFLH